MHLHFSRSEEKEIREVFLWGIILKGVAGIVEFVTGILLFFTKQATLTHLGYFLTHGELVEDPHDFIANTINGIFQHFTLDVKLFGSLYLLVHGAIDIFLVVGLLKGKKWAYPWALGFIMLFILYQVYYLLFITFSPWLLGITLFDTVLTGLIWHEWKMVGKK